MTELAVQYGVDALSPTCDSKADLKLTSLQGEQTIAPDKIKWLKDEPRQKTVIITLPEPITFLGSEIEVRYTWPGGFKNLFRNSKDVGQVPIKSRIDELKVEMEIESDHHNIAELRVQYRDPEKIEYLHKNEMKKRGFQINDLAQTWVVGFDVRLGS